MERPTMFAILWLAVAAMSFAALPAYAATLSALDGFDPGANDSVELILTQPDGKALVSGQFVRIAGVTTGHNARLNPDGSLDTTFSPGSAVAYARFLAMAVQADGKILVGGIFTLNNYANYNVMRLNPDGSIDDGFKASADYEVHSLAIRADGKILMGGGFTFVDGVQRPKLALLNQDGSLDTTFSYASPDFNFRNVAILKNGKLLLDGKKKLNPDGSEDASYHLGFAAPPWPYVDAMAVQPDGKILLGGEFAAQINGVTCGGIARINEDGSLDPTFRPGTGADEYQKVFSIALMPDGKIMVGGKFSSFNGARSVGLVRLNPDGSVDKTFQLGLGVGNWASAINVQPDGHILIGGHFTFFNESPRQNIARLNRDGLLDTHFSSGSGTNDVVRVMITQTDGKAVIGGSFTKAFGVECSRIARLNGNGALDTSFNTGSGPNGIVYALAQQSDGKIIVGGDFVSVAGEARSFVARLNADGSLDDTFHPGSIDRLITSVALQPDGKLLIGGRFTTINGNARKGIARLKANGSLDQTFNPGIGADNGVNAFAILPGGKILVGGYRLFARLNSDGSVDTSFTPAATCELTMAISVSGDGKILVGGNNFVNTGQALWANAIVIRLRADGSLDSGFAFAPQKYQQIMTLAVRPDGKILIGGDFTTINGVTRNRIAQLNSNGSLDSSFNPGTGADGVVYKIVAQPDNKSIIGGNFNAVNGQDRSKLARLNANGSVDAGYNSSGSGANDSVFALGFQPDEKLVLGGAFTAINNVSARTLSRLGYDGWFDPAFHSGAATNGNVFCAAAQADGKTVLGGVFTSVNGTTQSRIARLNSDGLIDPAFKTGSGADAAVYSIAMQRDGKILIGGEFTQFNGKYRGRVTRINPDGSLDGTFISNANQRVSAMGLQADGKIVIGGAFTAVGNVAATRIARLNADGKLDLPFSRNASADQPIEAVVIQPDGKIVVAGQFHAMNGVTRRHIARLNPDGTLDTGFNLDVNGDILSLALQADGAILLAGNFTTVNGYPRNRIARIRSDGWLDTAYDPGSGANGIVDAIALGSDGKLIMGGDFTRFNGVLRNRIARLSNPTAASQALTLGGNESVTWALGGSFPQPYQVLFEHSYDGLWWEKLGWGEPVPGIGYRLAGFRLPLMMNHYIRATGWTTGGLYNGSVSLVQSTLLAYMTPSRNAAREWVLYN